MTTIHHEIHAACPPSKIWKVLANLEEVARYNPGVRSAETVWPCRTGVGATRACDLVPKGRVVERVTHWEEGQALGLEVTESDWPIHFMRWVTRLEPSNGGTRISQELEYELKFGPVGWLLDRLVMKKKLTETLDGVFSSLVKHAEGPGVERRE